ncbi:hypothetical protein Lal_00045828 [Lupinus albus]|nr:hypothetical protein Lal_00045828 [Lupinus albus]
MAVSDRLIHSQHHQRMSNAATFTFAATFGLAVPLTTPHPTVCGQFPSSQSPSIGNAAAVNCKIFLSPVNILPHRFLIVIANTTAMNPIAPARNTATTADNLAREGLLAPSSFPTRVDTANPSDEGKTVYQYPTHDDHDLIPPPLQANGNTARRRKLNQWLPAAEALSARILPRVTVDPGYPEIRHHQNENGEVRSGGGGGDASNAVFNEKEVEG